MITKAGLLLACTFGLCSGMPARAQTRCPDQNQLNTEVSSKNSDVHRGTDDAGTNFYTWTLSLHEDPLHVLRLFFDEPITLNTPIELAKGCRSGVPYCGLFLGFAERYPGEGGVIGSSDVLRAVDGSVTITAADGGIGHFKANVTPSRWTSGEDQAFCELQLPAFTVDLPIQDVSNRPLTD